MVSSKPLEASKRILCIHLWSLVKGRKGRNQSRHHRKVGVLEDEGLTGWGEGESSSRCENSRKDVSHLADFDLGFSRYWGG